MTTTLLIIGGLAVCFALFLLYAICAVSARAERMAAAMVDRVVKDTQPNEDTL